MRILFVISLLIGSWTVRANEIRPLNFDFVAPIVSSTSDAPNQVGLIVYDSTNKMFFGRTTNNAPYQWAPFGSPDLGNLSTDIIPATNGGINIGAASRGINDLYVNDKVLSPNFPDSFLHFYPDGSTVLQAAWNLGVVSTGQSLAILTVDKSQPREIYIISNDSDHGWGPYGSNKDSGLVEVGTGQTQGSGNSGILRLRTGASDSNSGNIELTTGAAGGTRGYINLDAASLRMPTGTTDPSGVEGAMYYNTSTHKLRLFSSSGWISLN